MEIETYFRAGLALIGVLVFLGWLALAKRRRKRSKTASAPYKYGAILIRTPDEPN